MMDISSTYLRDDELIDIQELFDSNDLQGILDIFDDAMREYQLEIPDCTNCDRVLTDDMEDVIRFRSFY